jgi:hypothetical protein
VESDEQSVSRRHTGRNRNRFPKLSPLMFAIIALLAVLYFLVQDRLWQAAFATVFGTLYFALAVLVVCSIIGPVVWYIGRMVVPGIWRARRLRILRDRRALRECNERDRDSAS